MPTNPAPVAITKRTDHRHLQSRMRELAELDELMRQPGGLAQVPEPVPLHRRRANTDGEAGR